ncbi:DUF6383 domain-containing protein [Tannerella forsythia]|uniref:DUF6383 domain-containing protein n=1 Tax=Tannerella forsythia TaxID=28112 RepID=A0A3P1XL01_TANFO|nr:DUF6383 domain-containing protein [Tannerella forsythia]RRD59211.1 hypothetical protein EII40_10740 [Tannerella forsythia]
MNKKVFTLLAASLMLFVTAFMASAQTLYYGDAVKYLPEGVGKGAYHLKVKVEAGNGLEDRFLAMDEYGYVTLVDPATYIYGVDVPADSAYLRLRASMWCVNVTKEVYGKVPGFSFTNKEYGTELAFEYGEGETFDESWCITGVSAQKDLPLVGGKLGVWKFSRTYNTVPLEQEQYLAIEVKPDYYMTFAINNSCTGGPASPDIRLVVAHKDQFDKNADFYKNDLLKFTLVSARSRVLTENEFNTMMYEYSKPGYRQLQFSQKVSEGQVNPFEQPLMAEGVGLIKDGEKASYYMKLKNEKGEYVTALSAEEADYVNDLGIRYPKIAMTKQKSVQGDWRLVYYPSEDSVVINVRSLKHIVDGDYEDNGEYLSGEYDNLFNQTIWNFLTVRMQDLSAGERVVTVRNKPANVRGFFNINSCVLYDKNRTTVESDLYTIRDKDGRYLVVPMYAGSFTPQWMYLDENEVANMTPSCQWFVEQVNEGSEISKIHLTNREFDDIRIEYVQIYKDYELFNGVWWRLNPEMKKKDYSPVMGKNYVKAESFTRVPKPYRNDPYLGYRFFSRKPSKKGDPKGGIAEATDSLNWFAYSFHWLSGLTKNGYLGFEDKASEKDTIFYVLDDDKTFFQLVVPDHFRDAASYGMEKYGIGWSDGLLTGKFDNENSDDYIAKLERWYYHLKINDYWKFKRNEYYLVLDDNGRYGYTKEAIAEARKLNKAKFYLRFTYQVDGQNYYALIDRIDKSNFHYYTTITGLEITDTIRVHDNSHGTVLQESFGVVHASVDPLNRYVRSQPKTAGGQLVSTFALSYDTEPLYRRFNTTAENAVASDDPDTLKFHRTAVGREREYIYEDAHSIYSYTVKPVKGKLYSSINFMGVQNEDDAIANKDKDQIFKRHLETDWAIYVDTAYVNRGTGHIKPQYLLAVDPKFGYLGCPVCGEHELDRPYVYARYLRNQTDSARDKGMPNGDIVDEAYIWNSRWERLSFTPAIHAGDSLYILNGRPIEDFIQKDAEGNEYVNYKKLRRDSVVVIRDLSNNLHKDEVFSFRFTEVGGGSKKDFLIESETTNRDVTMGRMIAPMIGGWVKIQNGVPVISRGSFSDWITEAEVWNVKMTDKAPLANTEVAVTDVKVVAGTGELTVLNASGKKVTVSNILGQTIAKVVLTSDNESIAVPQGVAVVAIEGENAVKAVVK